MAVIREQITNSKGNNVKFLDAMSSILPGKVTDNIECVPSVDGSRLLYGLEAANCINKYFAEISLGLDKKFTDDPRLYPSEIPLTSVELCEFVGPRELHDEIKNIDESKSCGILGLSTKVLKVALLATENIFHHIINKCLVMGIFPQVWKTSITTPIPEKVIVNCSIISALYPFYRFRVRSWKKL